MGSALEGALGVDAVVRALNVHTEVGGDSVLGGGG